VFLGGEERRSRGLRRLDKLTSLSDVSPSAPPGAASSVLNTAPCGEALRSRLFPFGPSGELIRRLDAFICDIELRFSD
jgi:hypothetical protein